MCSFLSDRTCDPLLTGLHLHCREGEQEESQTIVDKHEDRARKCAKITLTYQGKDVMSAGYDKKYFP
jgi:hypothetical protein